MPLAMRGSKTWLLIVLIVYGIDRVSPKKQTAALGSALQAAARQAATAAIAVARQVAVIFSSVEVILKSICRQRASNLRF